ncbi:helix-turn-helix domain-containing protein [Lacticaseibacillus rhamnosus]|jgi:hypothetical protein
MKSKSNRVFQNNVRKNISDNHMLQKDYAKSIGITTRQLAHLLQDNNVSLAKLDDFAERVGIDPLDLIRPSESK